MEVVAANRVCVLLVCTAEAFEDDGDEQIDHHDAKDEDEGNEVEVAEPCAAFGGSMLCEVFERLAIEAKEFWIVAKWPQIRITSDVLDLQILIGDRQLAHQ